MLRGNGSYASVSMRIWAFWIQGKAQRESDEKDYGRIRQRKTRIPGAYQLEAILSLGMPAVKIPCLPDWKNFLEKIKWEKFWGMSFGCGTAGEDFLVPSPGKL